MDKGVKEKFGMDPKQRECEKAVEDGDPRPVWKLALQHAETDDGGDDYTYL